MLNLLAANVSSTIMEVFIILGVVIAASLIIYFIWEAVLSYSAKKKGEDKKHETTTSKHEANVQSYTFEEQPKLLESGNIVDVNVDEAQKEEEEIANAESEEERLNRERREYLERRRQELIRKLQEEQENQEDEEEPEEETEETEETEEVEEEPVVEEEEDEDETVEEEVEEDNSAEEIARLEAEKEELLKEKERYEEMCRALEEEKQQLLESVEANNNLPVVVAPKLSLDDLYERLREAEEQLKVNEKDLKQCKKDYVPLNRIWKTHEKDKKKLERKEAKVAKQKVMLYGVNNYEDIDEEKARKLAEDLDLYDGLKLSVQHCEEVMEKNADRYPLLKKMYEVLKRQNTDLKEEIKSLKEQIAELEEEQGNTSEGEEE